MTKADSALEIGLTEYLSEYLVEHNIYGVLIEGDSFDVGNPKDYYQTLINYGE